MAVGDKFFGWKPHPAFSISGNFGTYDRLNYMDTSGDTYITSGLSAGLYKIHISAQKSGSHQGSVIVKTDRGEIGRFTTLTSNSGTNIYQTYFGTCAEGGSILVKCTQYSLYSPIISWELIQAH